MLPRFTAYEQEPVRLHVAESPEEFTEAQYDEVLDAVLRTTYIDSGELADGMQFVGEQLPRWGLEHLVAFNTAYLSLSCTVRDAVRRGARDPSEPQDEQALKFLYPEVVEQTMGIFAELWFRQVYAFHHVGIKAVDEAWRPLFDGSAGKNASPGIQFLLGMNAHIVYDLPQALDKSLRKSEREAKEAQDPEDEVKAFTARDYYEDYIDTVGVLIDRVAEQMARAYVPGNDWTRKYLTQKTVARIARWRDYAWDAGLQLKDTESRSGQYEGVSEEPHERSKHRRRIDVTRGRVAAKAIMRECRRRALRNARAIGLAGRAALAGVATIGGEPPMEVARLLDYLHDDGESIAA
jgi:hypothetical protein